MSFSKENETSKEVKYDKIGTDHNYKLEIIWTNLIYVLSIHICAVYGLYLMMIEANYLSIPYFLLGASVSTIGIQGGAHRLWSHRSYKAKLPFRVILMLLATSSGHMGTLYDWCRWHRVHHKYSETDADPHNAKRGFFFSHIGWVFCEKHPVCQEKLEKVDLSDLDNDPVVQFQKKYYVPLLFVFWGVIPTFIPWYFWGETLRSSIFIGMFLKHIFQINMTWLVNSYAHKWGGKPYDKNINPVDLFTIKPFAFGEGYHNYHHTFPWDYSTSELGPLEVFNPPTLVIDLFAKIGWTYDLKKVSKATIDNKRQRSGSFSKVYEAKSRAYELLSGVLIFMSPAIFLSLIKFLLNKVVV